MKQTKQRSIILALAVLLALFAGCKGESPTAPPPITGTSGGGTGSGTTQPPVGASIALTASTLSPFTGSTSTITATVTVNNTAVPNGTAVEFATPTANANFTDTSDNPVTLIRTTTGGIAKATLTSSVAGPVVVNVTVNNVTKSITLTFGDVTIPVTPPSTAPTIIGVSPNSGLPTGNQQVTITGSNFRPTVRVLFDPGNGQAAKDAFTTSVTPTQLTVISPAFDLGVSQQLVVSITVIVEAGLPTEQRVTKASAFTYTAAVLTPVIRALAPTTGPIGGGTVIAITGDAFEAPLQVFFGSAQAQVLNVTFHEVDVVSPTARDTNPNGSGAVTGPVDIKILNVNSGKSVTASSAFRYVNKAQITAITPNQGPFTGGTRFTIDGTGFTDPVTVVLDGIAASVIKVSSSEIIGISSPIAVTGCADSTGLVVVGNVDNGDSATGPSWIYRVLKPVIISVQPASTPFTTVGGNATVTVSNAVGFPRITVGGLGAGITNTVQNPDGTTTFTIQVPATLQLATQPCAGATGASAPQPTAFDVVYTSLSSGCSDTLTKGLTVAPPSTPTLTLSPTSFTPFSATITPPVPPAVIPTVSSPPPQTVQIVNTGGAPLLITSVTTSGAGCGNLSGQISVTVPPPQTLNACDTAPITASYKGTTVPSSAQCTVTINTNDTLRNPKILQLSGSSQ